MHKLNQTLLLTTVISFACIARLMTSGWFFFLGIISILALGIIHLVVHNKSLDWFAAGGSKSILLMIASHLTFLGMFLFQVDFGDSNSWSVLGKILSWENDLFKEHGFIAAGLCFGLYIGIWIKIEGLRRATKKKNNTTYVLLSVFLTLAVCIGFILIYANR